MGTRGFGLAAPQLDYEPVTIAEAIAHVNANVLVVLQIETRTALERIDELLAVPNIDAVLIGPGDLSISLGIPGEFDHPQFVAAVETIRDRCARAGVAPGMHMRSLELGKQWTGRGLQLVSCNSDLGFLLDKATETVRPSGADRQARVADDDGSDGTRIARIHGRVSDADHAGHDGPRMRSADHGLTVGHGTWIADWRFSGRH